MKIQKLDYYICHHCGNIVQVMYAGGGELVCCGEPMERLKENFVEASLEKHVPVLEVVGDKVKVKIGEIAHPMEAGHYIEWVEVLTTVRLYRKYFSPELDREAEAEFIIEGEVVKATAYCNLHGLWSK